MPIPISREPEALGGPLERCCFCRVQTPFWTDLPGRTGGGQVACCQKCADERDPSEVPTKQAWCDKERALEPRTYGEAWR